MNLQNRREFFVRTLLTGSVVVPSGRLFGQVPAGQPNLPRDQESIKNLTSTSIQAITQCRLIAKEKDRLYCDDGTQAQTVVLGSRVKVWKGIEREDISELKPGDVLDIRLERGSDGEYRGAYVWANVVKYEGIIVSMSASSMTILPFYPHTRRQDLTDTPVAVRWTSNTLFPLGTTATHFRLQRAVMVFGLRLPDGSVEASRVVFGDVSPTRP